MFELSDTTKRNLEESFGMSLSEFDKMTADEQQQWVENKIGRKLSYNKTRRNGIYGRGNPLLARRKIRTFSDLEQKSKRLFGI